MMTRLGFGVKERIPRLLPDQKSIWVHALSVGEVTSAVPLLQGFKKKHPTGRIVFTVSTRSGEAIARKLLTDLTDCILPAPIDFLPVTILFYAHIEPQLFILIETDFWPNLLLYLKKKKIPSVLVNGRISKKSMTGYRRFSFFFYPMFNSFRYLFMQTELDNENMASLNIERKKIKVIGNLKYDTNTTDKQSISSSLSELIPGNKLVITAGSTHIGEEEILFSALKNLLTDYPQIILILAPRNPHRTDQIRLQAEQYGLTTTLRSENIMARSNILIIDNIGELVSFYALSDIAFVGGSLIDEGGHNPIEPAILGIPVLFGPYMQDFHEIALSLINANGGEQINDSKSLQIALIPLLSSTKLRHQRGKAAKQCIFKQRGVIAKHLEILQTLL